MSDTEAIRCNASVRTVGSLLRRALRTRFVDQRGTTSNAARLTKAARPISNQSTVLNVANPARMPAAVRSETSPTDRIMLDPRYPVPEPATTTFVMS
ncbi:MAG TPA: hypothetical protein VHP57_00215, partial [Acidimicrobiia bacterium]|nr:hypothetical protein [Acidimicrobiia bacterium]